MGCSCNHIENFIYGRDGFSVFKAIGKNAKCHGFNFGEGSLTCLGINHAARQIRYLGDPAAIVFVINFDSKAHRVLF